MIATSAAMSFSLSSITRHDISFETARIALPILAGNLVALGFALTEGYFLARVDAAGPAMAGVGVVMPLTFLMIALALSLQTGVAAATATALGERDDARAARATLTGILLGAALGLAGLAAIWALGGHLLQLVGSTELSAEGQRAAATYLHFSLPGFIALIVARSLLGTLQGHGQTTPLLRFVVIAGSLNALLCAVSLTQRWGVAGLAWASTLSTVLALADLLLRHKLRLLSTRARLALPSCADLLTILQIGAPQFLNLIATAIQAGILNWYVGRIGEAHLSAWVLGTRLDQLLFAPMTAIAGATLVLAARAFGQHDIHRLERILRANLRIGLAVCALFTVAYVLAARLVVSQFTDNVEIIALTTERIRLTAWCSLAMMVGSVVIPVFQATKRPWAPVCITFFGRVASTWIFAILLSREHGLYGIYTAFAIGTFIQVPIYLVWIRVHLKRTRLHIRHHRQPHGGLQ